MKRFAGSLILAGTVAVTGCSTINPYTGEKQTSKATSGAAIGAVAGAGIGAITGGGVGYYMDVQEAKLRQKLEGAGVSVTRDGENIILNMPGNLTFATDSTNVKSSFSPVLDAVAEVLKEYKSTMIQVAGHTDSTGGDRYNLLLSQQRAQAVANSLAGFGVEQVRMDIVGFGETQPIASNSTASGREQNRRVELTLLPYTD